MGKYVAFLNVEPAGTLFYILLNVHLGIIGIVGYLQELVVHIVTTRHLND
jgi:hypothetical protein